MELKKNPKADLESKRALFIQIGLILALGSALVAFEWKTVLKEPGFFAYNDASNTELELPPILLIKKPELEIPKPNFIPIEILILVPDDTDTPDNTDAFISESTEDTEIKMELKDEDTEPIPYYNLSEKPVYPGGERAMLIFLASSIKYPLIAVENDIKGTVYLSFVISKTGKVEKVEIIRGVHPAIDKEAVRVVSSMPDWTPGVQGTSNVAVSFQVPIRFTLQ